MKSLFFVVLLMVSQAHADDTGRIDYGETAWIVHQAGVDQRALCKALQTYLDDTERNDYSFKKLVDLYEDQECGENQ